LKLWMVIRSLGTEKMANTIREHVSYARELKEEIERNHNFELLAPVNFSTVVFRFNPHSKERHFSEADLNQLNEKLLEAVNRTGEVFLSHTKLRGKFAIRLTIGNLKTTWRDVSRAWSLLQSKAHDLSPN